MGFFSKPIDVAKSIDENDEGYRLLQSGNAEMGMDLLHRAASVGQPNALGTIMWTELLRNNIAAAVEVHDKCFNKIPTWLAALAKQENVSEEDVGNVFLNQITNIQSNLGFAMYLRDGISEIQLQVLSEAGEYGNEEALLLASHILPDLKDEFNLSPAALRELRSTFESVVNETTRYVNVNQEHKFKNLASDLIIDIDERIASYDIFTNFDKSELDPFLVHHGVSLMDIISNLDENYETLPNSWFNVETAEMFVSNFFPAACDACEGCLDVAQCEKCGRIPRNFLTCMTANKDSDFLLFELADDSESSYSQGTLVSFGLSLGEFRLEIPPVVPVVLGKISLEEGGTLFFGDKFATSNGSDFVSSAVLSGDQTVIAWVGVEEDDEQLTPLVLTTSDTALTDSLLEAAGHAGNYPSNFTKCIKESLTGSVFARFGNTSMDVANTNMQLVQGSLGETHPLRLSWLNQLFAQNNFQEFTEMLLQAEQIEFLLLQIDFLRVRGQAEAAIKLYEIINSRRADELTDNLRKFMEISASTKPGQILQLKDFELLT